MCASGSTVSASRRPGARADPRACPCHEPRHLRGRASVRPADRPRPAGAGRLAESACRR
jgi:hypothetical protein